MSNVLEYLNSEANKHLAIIERKSDNGEIAWKRSTEKCISPTFEGKAPNYVVVVSEKIGTAVVVDNVWHLFIHQPLLDKLYRQAVTACQPDRVP